MCVAALTASIAACNIKLVDNLSAVRHEAKRNSSNKNNIVIESPDQSSHLFASEQPMKRRAYISSEGALSIHMIQRD
jgi:hypothetical protein